mmetsp:Transcript_126447/g.352343  ORF Transcript_126447/g.352343 Transcript_126447/m.352343 type:complete len:230 (-) Transcript_126447:14-703(-)
MQQQDEASHAHVIEDVGVGDQGASDGVVQHHLPEVWLSRLQEDHCGIAQVVADGNEIESPQLLWNCLVGETIAPAEARVAAPSQEPRHPRLVSEDGEGPGGHGDAIASLEQSIAAPHDLGIPDRIRPPRLLRDHCARNHGKHLPEEELRYQEAGEDAQSRQEVLVLRVDVGTARLAGADLQVQLPANPTCPATHDKNHQAHHQIFRLPHGPLCIPPSSHCEEGMARVAP